MSEAVSGGSVPFSLGNFSPDKGFTSGPQQLASMGYEGFYPAYALAGADQVQLQNTKAAQNATPGAKKSISFGEMAINFIKGATVDTVKQIFDQLTTLPGIVMTAAAIGAVALIGAPAAIALAVLGLGFVGVQTLQNGGKFLSALSSGDGEQANEAARGMGNVFANLALIVAGGTKGIREGVPVKVDGKAYRLDPTVAKSNLSPLESLTVMLKALVGKVKYVDEAGNELSFLKALFQSGKEQAGAKFKAAQAGIQERWPSSLKRSGVKLEGANEVERLQSFLKLAQEDKAPVSQVLRDRLKNRDLGRVDEKTLTALAEEVELNSKLHLQAQKNPIGGGTVGVKESDELMRLRLELLEEVKQRKFEGNEAKSLENFIEHEKMTPNTYKAIRQQLETKGWQVKEAKEAEAFKANIERWNKEFGDLQKAEATRIQDALKAVDETYKEVVAPHIRTALRGKADSSGNYEALLKQYRSSQELLQQQLLNAGVKPEVAKTISLKPTVALEQDFTPRVNQSVANLSKTYSNKQPSQLTGRQVTDLLNQGDVPVEMNPFVRQYYDTTKFNTRNPGALPTTVGSASGLMSVFNGGGASWGEEAPAH